MQITVRGLSPVVEKGCFVAPTATLIGDVRLGERSSVWYNAVIRGDVEPIRIGRECNVQDGTVIHGTYGKCGSVLEDRVSVGHLVVLHGCHVGSGTLVGMGSILMDHSRIGKNCLVGAGSLVTEGASFEDGTLILGRPARAVRKLNAEELAKLEKSADNYLFYMDWYSGGNARKGEL